MTQLILISLRNELDSERLSNLPVSQSTASKWRNQAQTEGVGRGATLSMTVVLSDQMG